MFYKIDLLEYGDLWGDVKVITLRMVKTMYHHSRWYYYKIEIIIKLHKKEYANSIIIIPLEIDPGSILNLFCRPGVNNIE